MTDLFGGSDAPAMALARKWRPRTFADLKGQAHVVRALSNALEQGRLHHAYLFTGTRGVGKTTLARILAKCFNCETGVTASPCGVCPACRQIEAGRFVDVIELDAASNTGVDNMREVLDDAQYAPTAGRFKVYIIDEVHMLSRSAFNSMLKTLEEPPAHVKFILATTDPQKIPVTVLSRCLQFGLTPLAPALIASHLAEVLGEENVPAEPAALERIARAAAGSMRDALSLTDQAIAHGAGQLEDGKVAAMLGLAHADRLDALVDALAREDGAALIGEARSLYEAGLTPDALLQDLGTLMTRIALQLHTPGAFDAGAEEEARLVRLASRFDPETVQLYYQIVLNGRRDLPYAPDEWSGFAMTLLRMLAFAPGAQGQGGHTRPAAPTPARSPASPAPPAATPAFGHQPARPENPPRGGEARDDVSPSRPARAEPEPARARPAQTGQAAPPQADSGEVGARSVFPAPPSSVRGLDAAGWLEIVRHLGTGGMVRMLAEQCAFVDYRSGRLELRLDPAHRHLLDAAYRERLVEALKKKLGAPLEVHITLGAAEAAPAPTRERERAQRQAEAVAAIESDPVVRELVERFDARIETASIRPVDPPEPVPRTQPESPEQGVHA